MNSETFWLSLRWDSVIFGNSVSTITTAFLIFAGVYISFYIFEQFILRKLRLAVKSTHNSIDDVLIAIVESIDRWTHITVSSFVATRGLQLPEGVHIGIMAVMLAFLVRQAVKVVDVGITRSATRHSDDKKHVSQVGLVKTIAKAIVWSVGLLLIMANVGIDVTSLVAGLGVGGIAIALALQNILGDVFSSLAIYFDKPFTVGDFIIVGTEMGTVKKVGIKTTRIRSLTGEELVIPNVDLTQARIQNFKKLKERRAVISLGVSYDTDQGLLQKLPEWIQQIVEKHEHIKFDRAHLKNLGNSAIEYEIVYQVMDPDYGVYMDIQQSIILEILALCQKKQIEIAYPTQTVFVKRK